MSKMNPSNGNETKSAIFPRTYSNLTSYIFCQNIKVFQWLSKSKFLTFMTNVNPSNGNETKSAIFPWGIFKSDVIYFLSRNIKAFQWLSKSEFLSFMTKVNPNNGNETKLDNFHETYSKLTSLFICRKILKYFNNFYNWHLSISLQKFHVQVWQHFYSFTKWYTI